MQGASKAETGVFCSTLGSIYNLAGLCSNVAGWPRLSEVLHYRAVLANLGVEVMAMTMTVFRLLSLSR